MPTVRETNSLLLQGRRLLASGLFQLASRILRCSVNSYEGNIISPVVVRVALLAVRLMERLAAVLASG
jgi:hypothetical protein